jgi:hypothetical protein
MKKPAPAVPPAAYHVAINNSHFVGCQVDAEAAAAIGQIASAVSAIAASNKAAAEALRAIAERFGGVPKSLIRVGGQE